MRMGKRKKKKLLKKLLQKRNFHYNQKGYNDVADRYCIPTKGIHIPTDLLHYSPIIYISLQEAYYKDERRTVCLSTRVSYSTDQNRHLVGS